MPKIYIWYNKKKNLYYYKICKGYYIYNSLGDVNQYGHELVLIIDIPYKEEREPLKKRLIKKLISFLEKMK